MHPLLVSLDLDFPGLKSVRAAYQAGDISLALNELVAYFRARPEPDAALLARPDPASLHAAEVALRHEFEFYNEPGKVPGLERFYLDIGARDKASVGVKVGDTACFFRPFEEVGGRLVSKAMDDRVGCAVLLQVLRDLESSPHDVHVVFTVQEEVGLRGATTSGFGVDPEVAIAVDVTDTGDTPECSPMAVHLGKGPAIKVRDSGMLAHVGVKDWLVRTAEGAGIPFQLEVLDHGTTDARALQTTRAGVPAGCVSVPTRYIHSPSEMVDPDDVRDAVRLLVAALSGPIAIG